ncbi:hypothetical protein M0D70_01245 [Acinetobacter portensis]|uniref:Uncharacterized protein n=1 Tax=Acinetobacter portensis TaxID=1839785 RepID=A0ABY4JTR7_9GAMM|nr:hypothetical protein [Acinetobacter portensis]MCK7608057.1 hypothetical protein [Acinetobacter portensis]MCK7638806.1 hypothetical protein [Acinetobacter portensis]UPO22837.1 hypothetical protein MZO21_10225 [Acinetobacter portensis]
MEKYSNFNPVIMGAATGYEPQKVELFLNSILLTNFGGVVVLFVNDDQLDIYQEYFKNKYSECFELRFVITKIGTFSSSNAFGKNCKKIIRYLSQYIVLREPKLKKDFIYYFAPPHVSRFFDYSNFLKLNHFTHVVLTDTRDVIVQGDLSKLNCQGLFLGMEDKSLLLGNDSFHIKWISDVYGKTKLSEISHKQISCAGVTFGDYKSIKFYLETMLNEFMELPYYTMVRSNYDQGIHNKLLYEGVFSNINLCQPLDSEIATLGVMNMNEVILNEENYVLNSNKTIPMFIHQYDRHKDLEYIFQNKYL